MFLCYFFSLWVRALFSSLSFCYQYQGSWLPGKIRPRIDLLCVEWDVKPCSTQLSDSSRGWLTDLRKLRSCRRAEKQFDMVLEMWIHMETSPRWPRYRYKFLRSPLHKVYMCQVTGQLYIIYLYHCVHEKKTKMFFCNIFYKTQTILMKIGE